MEDAPAEKLVISRERVADHGEVLTGRREVVAMLDLVKAETQRIDSRFLEPACGNGNFLAEILERKLRVVTDRYGRAQHDWERYGVLAVSSLYGIDLLEDNVAACRQRLAGIFAAQYQSLFKTRTQAKCVEAVHFILGRNIVWGDALTLRTAADPARDIVFSEWSPVNGHLLKRRDFTFHELLGHAGTRGLPLFSDLGEEAFIPTPEKEYPPIHFLEVGDVA